MSWIASAFLVIALTVPALAKSNSQALDTFSIVAIIIALFLIYIIFLIYFLPYRIGKKRGVSTIRALFFVNLFFAGTGLGWLICLLWAATGATRAQDVFFAKEAQKR